MAPLGKTHPADHVGAGAGLTCWRSLKAIYNISSLRKTSDDFKKASDSRSLLLSVSITAGMLVSGGRGSSCDGWQTERVRLREREADKAEDGTPSSLSGADWCEVGREFKGGSGN